jgi:hypothetical protein
LESQNLNKNNPPHSFNPMSSHPEKSKRDVSVRSTVGASALARKRVYQTRFTSISGTYDRDARQECKFLYGFVVEPA